MPDGITRRRVDTSHQSIQKVHQERERLLYRRRARGMIFSLRAPVAQLDRATGFEPVGRRFESCRAHQNSRLLLVISHSSSVVGRW